MSQQGREVVIVEAARTPIGRGDSEKGYYRDTHLNELLDAAYKAVNFGAAFTSCRGLACWGPTSRGSSERGSSR